MNTLNTPDPARTVPASLQSVPLELKPQAGYQSMFPIIEGDLWRWQLETLTELTRFIKAHAPGKPGSLPIVQWHVSDGFHATARLLPADGPTGKVTRDRREVLAAYAQALGSEVTSVDLGGGRGTEYRLKGTIGKRVTLLLIAYIHTDDADSAAADSEKVLDV